MSQTGSSIIKPSAGGTTLLKEEAGGTALTIDASGDVQIANSLTAGKLGSSVVVPQATTKHVHRYTSKNYSNEINQTDEGSAAGMRILFGIFKPIDRANSLWIECSIPIQATGQDQTSNGLVFARHGGGTDVNLVGKGYSYNDIAAPATGMGTMSQYVGVAGNTFGAGDSYNIYWRINTANSNPRRYTPDAEEDARLKTATEAHLVIYEYKNYQ